MAYINEMVWEDKVNKLGNVIKTLRSLLIAMGIAPHLLDQIEDEAYNKEIK